MGLETGTYINSLVATNPVGASDPKSQGDDHLRLLKSTIKATFPNLTGAMNSTQTQLNYLSSATGTTGTASANVVFSAGPTFTGTVTIATLAVTSVGAFTLTGTLSTASTLTIGGTGETLATFADDGAVVLYYDNTARLDTKSDGVNIVGELECDSLDVDGAADLSSTLAIAGMITSTAAAALSLNSNGFLRTDNANLFTAQAGASGYAFRNNGNNATLVGIDNSGVLTTLNASAAEIGYKGIPCSVQSDNYTCVLADAGKLIQQAGGSKTCTIPANASVAFPIGTVIMFEAIAATTIAITTDTMYLAGTAYATTGSRTLAQGGIATALKRSVESWIISGTGLS